MSVATGTAWAEERPPITHQVLAWKIPTLPTFGQWSAPLVLDYTFVGFYDEGHRDPVVCASLADGQIYALVRRLPPELSHGGITGAGGLVAVVPADGSAVLVYDPCSLDPKWRFAPGAGERVTAVVGVGDRFVAVVSGAERWRFVRLRGDGTKEDETAAGAGFPPAVLRTAGGVVLALAPDGHGHQEVTAFWATFGQLLWHKVVEQGPVTIGDGAVVIAHPAQTTLEVLDAQTGHERARVTEVALTGLLTTVAMDGRQLIYAMRSGSNQLVTAIDLPAGKLRWRRSASLPFMQADQPPPLLLDQDVVYVATDDGRLTALERTAGREVWSYSVGGVPSPMLADWPGGPRLVVPTDAGAIFVFERRPERPRDAIVLDGSVHLPPGIPPRPVTLQLGGRRIHTDRHGHFQLRAKAGETVTMAIDDKDLGQIDSRDHTTYWDRIGSHYLVLSEEKRQRLELDADYPSEE